MYFKRICLALALVLLFAAPSAQAEETAAPTLTVLKNGFTVLTLRDDRFPLASVRLYVHAGSAYETPEQSGISHLLEHMVFKSTAKRAEGQVAKDVEGAGGDINAATSFDYTVFYTDMPAREWRMGMDVIHDMLFGAKFNPDELKREKEVVLAELEQGEDNPSQRLFKTLQAQIWPDSAYGRPIIGSRKTVRAVTSEDLHAHIGKYYQPQSMTLVVVGDVEPGEVEAEAARLFGNLQNDRAVTPPVPAAVSLSGNGPRVALEFGGFNKVYLRAAFEIPGMNTPDEAGLEVLARLLGGDDASRLYRMFKYEKRLVDDIHVAPMALERTGMFMIGAVLDADNLEAFWKGLAQELAGLSGDSFSEAEIARAKLNLEDGLYRTKETVSGLAAKIGLFNFFGYGPQGEQHYLASLESVDRAQLDRLIHTWLRPDALHAAMLLPKAEQGAVTEKGLEKIIEAAWPAAKTGLAETTAAGGKAGPEILDVAAGRKLVLLPDATLPYVSLSLVYKGGDALLAPDQQGLAALASESMLQGTASMGAVAYRDYLADRAAAVDISAGRESFTLETRFPARFTPDLLALVSETLAAPAFDAKDFDRAKSSQLAAVKAREDKPMGLAFRNLFPFLFKNGSYAYKRLGMPKAVRKYTPEQARAFWKKQQAMPWVLAVCGDFDRKEILAFAKELAEKPKTPTPFAPQTPEWGEEHAETLSLPGREQAHLLMVYPLPGETSPDTPAFKLLDDVLSGQGGLLFGDMRDKQSLGYTVTSFLWQTPKTGFLALYIGADPDNTARARAAFAKIIKRLATTPLDAKELERGKNLLWGDYHRGRQSQLARSDQAARDVLDGWSLDHERREIEAAMNLTGEDLRRVVKKYLAGGDPYVMVVAP